MTKEEKKNRRRPKKKEKETKKTQAKSLLDTPLSNGPRARKKRTSTALNVPRARRKPAFRVQRLFRPLRKKRKKCLVGFFQFSASHGFRRNHSSFFLLLSLSLSLRSGPALQTPRTQAEGQIKSDPTPDPIRRARGHDGLFRGPFNHGAVGVKKCRRLHRRRFQQQRCELRPCPDSQGRARGTLPRQDVQVRYQTGL